MTFFFKKKELSSLFLEYFLKHLSQLQFFGGMLVLLPAYISHWELLWNRDYLE